MKKMKICFMVMAALVVMACSKDKIETWESKSFVWFVNTDTTVLSFLQYDDDVKEAMIEFELSMAGQTVSYDRKIDVQMSTPPSGAGTKVEVTSAVIPADSVNGVVKIKVFRTANLTERADTMVFKLCATEYLEVGDTSQLKKALVIADMAVKPGWWNNWADYYIGNYSEERYRVIIAATGSTGSPAGEGWYGSEWLLNKYLLKKYVQDYGPFYEADGVTEITFPNL